MTFLADTTVFRWAGLILWVFAVAACLFQSSWKHALVIDMFYGLTAASRSLSHVAFILRTR